ncbi:MAG: UDP-N-acetylmuramoyl-L-alanyl-D-glutamate--2,6-diaminopimelate ligase [Microthrixaceae bacterium]|nr:UDP-N-acetylmuramoyl-L-alanyl-D-glutamate--2,6-diaminopimelate ligase [Microthrixaceae bacterium]
MAGLDVQNLGTEAGAVELRAATHDSRLVVPGDVFCCVPGRNHDGHDHAPAAVAAGAAALLVERPLGLGVPELVVADVRRAMGPLAAALLGDPSHTLDVVGITGTNGKTTTAQMLASILNRAGRNCGVIGTLTGVRTTPEAPELQQLLAAFLAEGRRSVAMEVSSHALDLHRVDGTRFRVGVFTNLSRDHLDHHHDMAAYFQAKAALFTPELCDQAVLCTDDPHGRLLLDAAQIPSIGYSIEDAADLKIAASGSRFVWRGESVSIAMPGRFNVLNALAAATVADLLGVPHSVIAQGLADLGPIAGRFEMVDEGQPFLAAVDFAHTPDGLDNLLVAARELAGEGRVVVVFGAGGDRDPTKRPEMGEVVARLADVVVLTTDNPRHEDPAAIMAAVKTGLADHPDVTVEPDRATAIGLAVDRARPGDVVLIAGKGHETTQTIGDVMTPFVDREVLSSALRSRRSEGAW